MRSPSIMCELPDTRYLHRINLLASSSASEALAGTLDAIAAINHPRHARALPAPAGPDALLHTPDVHQAAFAMAPTFTPSPSRSATDVRRRSGRPSIARLKPWQPTPSAAEG